MINKNAQIAIIEFSLIIILFASMIIYFQPSETLTSKTYYQENIDTYLNSLTKEDEFRKLVSLEDLTIISHSENWTSTQNKIQNTHPNFELTIFNQTHNKTIFSCNSTYGKLFSQKLISSYNLTLYEPKIINFGVCY